MLKLPTPNPNRSRRAGWRSDALLVLGVLAVVLALKVSTPFFSGLEQRYFDWASTAHDHAPSDRIALIAIDDESIANMGRWPWPREVHAQLIDRLAQAGAKTVAHTAFFFEPQTDRGVERLRGLRELLQDPAASASRWADLGPAAKETLLAYIARAEQSLDADAALAASIRRAGQVLLPSHFTLGTTAGRPDKPLPAFAQRGALPDTAGYGISATDSQQPLPMLGEAARAVAHLNQLADSDGAVRGDALVLRFDGYAVPSMALALAAQTLNLGPDDMSVLPGEAVLLGKRRIDTDPNGVVLPRFYPSRKGRAPFASDSFHDVLSGKVPASKFAGKTVIIGATAAGVGTLFQTPISSVLSDTSPALSSAGILAHVASSIINGHFIAQPAWGSLLTLALTLLLLLYLVFGLPRLKAAAGAGLTATLLLGLLAVEYLLLAHGALWLPLVFPAALLLLGHLALVTRRFGITERRKAQSDAESAETNRMMGLAYLGQGQPDLAFDRLRRVPHGEDTMSSLQQLALDFERRRQFNKAQSVYEHMLRLEPGNAGAQERLRQTRALSQTLTLSPGSAHPGGSLLLAGNGVEQPMLGRYRVEKELGKGAMGVVYQGRDPRIGRVVAIKTLALSTEFEGGDLQDARERFFREAETAGRLQHPNIVTIYDAGEEHDLAYIAMEFLHGSDLAGHSRAPQLLAPATVLRLGERVARALAYAHQQNVVHRDIKPANIMYEAASDTVKVTDFGIARITDSSRTRTGMVLGTPSFMSPEQLAGAHIDGRSDLYALGVSLFQLLSGTLPFRGDSMSALMYQIANQAPPDVCGLRPELPASVGLLLQKAMAKLPEARFQDGQSLADRLAEAARDCASLPDAAVRALPATGAFERTGRLPPATDAGRYRSTVRTLGSTTMGFQPGGEPDFKL